MLQPFADRLLARVEERQSQVCLGLDPDPQALLPEALDRAGPPPGGPGGTAEHAGRAVAEHCRLLIERAGHACVAVKLQMACFERLGAGGVAAMALAADHARGAGLLVIADGKRGDVPVTAAAYGQGLVGETETPWGPVAGLRADAFTANPLMGRDALEPLVAAAEAASAGIFVLVRTSNPGAADLQDLDVGGMPLHERLAAVVAASSERLAGVGGLSGAGAVVGAIEPARLGRLRELMPAAIFLTPGVGAQGGRPEGLRAALGAHPASVIVPVSRSIAGAPDPAIAAEELRSAVWALAQGPGR